MSSKAVTSGKFGGLKSKLQQLLAVASLLLIFAFFSVMSPNFFQFSNIMDILFATVVIGVLAVGTTFVIITSGIDLSIGFGVALTAMVCGRLLITLDLPLWAGILGTLAAGALIGFINGFNVAVLGMPPFIATLAMMLVCRGLAIVLSDRGSTIYYNELPAFKEMSQGKLIPGVPNAILVLLAATAVGWVLLNRTLVGRYDFAIGSNEEATALSGINVRKWKIIIYTVAGVFTGLAGIMYSARIGSSPTAGTGYELEAIAAVVIGGTSLSGGKGTIVGSLIGALIVGTLNNGLGIMSVAKEWQYVILGVVIMLAVFVDMARKRQAT